MDRFESSSGFREAVELAIDLLISGAPVDQVSTLCKHLPDAELVLREAMNVILQRTGQDDLSMALHLERRREIFREAKKTKEFPSAIRALQDMARLEGLYEDPPKGRDGVNDEIPLIDDIDRLPVM